MRKYYNTLIAVALLCLSTNLFAQRAEIQTALTHLQQAANNTKFSAVDLKQPIITDHYTSQGITHIYFRQAYENIEIYGANAAVHMVNGKVFATNNNFLPSLQKRAIQSAVSISAAEAVQSVAAIKNYPINRSALKVLESNPSDKKKATLLSAAGISHSDIPARLVYVVGDKGQLNLAWDIAIDEIRGNDYMNYRVDARTGKILEEESWTIHCNHGDGHVHDESCSEHNHGHNHNTVNNAVNNFANPNSYVVYPWPIESPNFGSRSEVTEPWLDNTTASPNGWHTIGANNFTTTHGNNVDAYMDDDNTNGPTGGDAARADGGANLDFDFPLDVSGNPVDFQDAAVTNLFYWGNVTHDVWYNYGFDEASGNFQEDNLGRGGSQGDGVNMEAQDGSGTCNANMSTPPDGSNPRCQMYLCNGRDGDYDNGVVVHEYGHGISIRLTGGPSTSGCLNNQEQMGEGWSDYFGTVMTIEPGDQGADARPMGTWLFGQGPNGGGIRPHPYSTNFAVNPMTYATVASGVSVPHGVGSVWATMLWDMTWALIDEYGFDPDIYNGNGGNNRAMALVIEGLKLQPCSPGFVDGRDAILAADVALYGGANQCLIWEAFAARGLGFSANQGSSGSVSDGTEAFDLPPSCSIGLQKTASVSQVAPGGNITYTLTATNNTGSTLNNVVISDDLPANTIYVSGGSLSGNTVSFPAVSLNDGASHTVSFTVQVDGNINGTVPNFDDDIEGGSGNWTTSNSGSSNWNIQSGTANSGSNAWFAADVSSTSIANLVLASSVGLSANSVLSFTHSYDTEATWDGGLVAISTDGGSSWQDLGNNMTANGYNSTINNSTPGFSGNSGGFVTTTVDLSSYAGQNALIRFQMNCDVTVGGNGWWVDDVSINNLGLYIPNIAQVTDGNIISTGALANPTQVVGGGGGPLSLTVTGTNISCNGGSDGTASAIASSGSGTYTYLWSNNATTASISGLAAGTYTVDVSDGNTTESGSYTVTEPAALSVSASATSADNGNNGTATATVSGGTPPYSYSWTGGGTTATITGLAPGDYTVVVTDSNNCSDNATVTVIDNNVPTYCTSSGDQQNFEFIEAVAVGTINNTSGDNGGYGDFTAMSADLEQGGTINVTLTPGFVNSAYNEGWRIWIDYNQDLDFDDAGEEVFAPALSNTTITGTFAVPANAPLGTTRMRVSMNYNAAPPSCGTFTYGEVEDYTVNITTPTATPVSVTASSTDVSCNGGADGTATAAASGGTGNYTYTWTLTGNTVGTSASISGLSAGTYDVVVSDGNTSASASITISEPTALSVSVTGTNANGGNNGTAVANPSGGTSPYTYLWNNNATTQGIGGLAPGTYTVVVTDANGCSTNGSFTVGDDTPQLTVIASVNSNVSCNGGNDGSATASASGGVSPYNYNWPNGETTATAVSLPAGTHTVLVTDSNGNQVSTTVTISEPSALALSVTGTAANGGNNGSATANPSGGTPPYSYAWSNNATTQSINNLAPGTYSVIVTDANGCTNSGSYTVIDQTPQLTVSIFNSTDVSCNGGSDGSASAVANGGISPYTYLWDNGETTAVATTLTAGSRSVVVTDANGNTASASVTISQPSLLVLSMSSTNANGGSNGTATATPSGGTAPYSYSWDNGGTTQTISGLTSGNYLVVVTDANGCTASDAVFVGDDTPQLTVSISNSTDVSCNGGTDGTATANPGGGVGNYSYQWSNNETTQTAVALPAGTHSVVVTDGNGNTASASVTISEPTALSVAVTGTDANGGNNGTATANPAGGTAPYSYSWSNNGNTQMITGLAAGTYSVDVTDANGCVTTGSVTIQDVTPPPSGCQDNEVTLTLVLDNYPNETSWDVTDANGTIVASSNGTYSGFPNGSTQTEDLCLLDGCYNFTIYDTWGDGICCAYGQGSYLLTDAAGNVLGSGGDFDFQETTQMCFNTTPPPPPACSTVTVDFNDFEGGWGIWNDGGSDCRRSANDQNYALGTYCVRLRDNTGTSVMTTDNLDLSTFEEITVDFSYYPRSMDNSNEDFWLQISTDGGASYTIVEEWNRNDEFQNNQRYYDAVTVQGPFSSNTRIRFRCDASGNSDWIYIDEVEITGCTNLPNINPLMINTGNVSDNEMTSEMIDNNITDFEIETDFDNDLNEPSLKLFPNPVATELTIEYNFPMNAGTELFITDISGRTIQQVQITETVGEQRINVSQFQAGYYMVHAIYNGERMSQKFIVIK